MTHSLGTFMQRFFSHYLPVQKGLSGNTIATYRDAVKLLLCYAADTLSANISETLTPREFSVEGGGGIDHADDRWYGPIHLGGGAVLHRSQQAHWPTHP